MKSQKIDSTPRISCKDCLGSGSIICQTCCGIRKPGLICSTCRDGGYQDCPTCEGKGDQLK